MPSSTLEEIVERLANTVAKRVQSRISGAARPLSPRLLTVKEAAKYIGRSEQAVQHLIHKREFVVVRRGRRVHLDRVDLDKWIEANKV